MLSKLADTVSARLIELPVSFYMDTTKPSVAQISSPVREWVPCHLRRWMDAVCTVSIAGTRTSKVTPHDEVS